jgi:hemerythrin
MLALKTNPADNEAHEDNSIIVSWSENLSVGIELIDNQHKNLVAMTNQLFQACTRGGDKREAVFKETMSRMVEYIRVHFATEQELFQRINYPQQAAHKKEHDKLIVEVIDSSKEYGDGNKNIANKFVVSMRDWVFSHIAHSDKMYAIYISEQKKKGLLKDKDIEQ